MAETRAASHPESWSGAAVYFAALALLMFSNGRYPIAACAWRVHGLRALLLRRADFRRRPVGAPSPAGFNRARRFYHSP